MDKDDYYRKHIKLYLAAFAFGTFLIGVFTFYDRTPALLVLGIVYEVLSFIGIIYFSESENK